MVLGLELQFMVFIKNTKKNVTAMPAFTTMSSSFHNCSTYHYQAHHLE